MKLKCLQSLLVCPPAGVVCTDLDLNCRHNKLINSVFSARLVSAKVKRCIAPIDTGSKLRLGYLPPAMYQRLAVPFILDDKGY